ncbi:hypothetical protein [Mycolicibacterium celeriflavum]|uniref:Uncharacterized protein n=2 Tax=Mycolicibacterium celeriflavum TaxID=1249101 RepID=A0A7I7RF15_MYCCF|nr:hypothetical protein [Mycolicibacterium celeriflavum]MCV7239361.1 hypothetical protein [Mycolicibacterium celeriflavum]BBY43053.1 hypothetical protein MCEL_13480 [Mycolicibacterium celeriflavum]
MSAPPWPKSYSSETHAELIIGDPKLLAGYAYMSDIAWQEPPSNGTRKLFVVCTSRWMGELIGRGPWLFRDKSERHGGVIHSERAIGGYFLSEIGVFVGY